MCLERAGDVLNKRGKSWERSRKVSEIPSPVTATPKRWTGRTAARRRIGDRALLDKTKRASPADESKTMLVPGDQRPAQVPTTR